MPSRTSEDWLDDGLSAFAAQHAANASADWLSLIQQSIRDANLELDNVFGSYANNHVGQLSGFYAEAFHAGSFNVNAAKAGSEYRAFREGSTANGSSDIGTNWGEDYGSKYNKTPQQSVARQAEAASGTEGVSKYDGQSRLIPSDQLDEGRSIADAKVAKEVARGNADTAARYDETGANLTDRVRAPDGTESKPLTKAEADQWAQDAKDGNVRHFEINNEVFLKEHLAQIGKAAGGAAAIAVALQLAPVVVGGLNRLIKDPDYSGVAFGRDMGTWAKEKGGAVAVDAFVKASLGGFLATAQQLGHLGGPLANASPAALGGVAVVAVESMKAVWAWQRGECTGEQATSLAFASGVRTAAALQGAAIGQVLIPIPIVGAIVGTLTGSFLAEQGMQTMTNTTALILLQEVDRTFAIHQRHIDLLATTNQDYRAVALRYEAMLIRGGYLVEAADRRRLVASDIQEELDRTEKTGDDAVAAAQRRLDLWRGTVE